MIEILIFLLILTLLPIGFRLADIDNKLARIAHVMDKLERTAAGDLALRKRLSETPPTPLIMVLKELHRRGSPEKN
jgi:hypothetical protein